MSKTVRVGIIGAGSIARYAHIPGYQAQRDDVELDERVVERYRLPDPQALPDGFYSDMVFGKEHLYTPPKYGG